MSVRDEFNSVKFCMGLCAATTLNLVQNFVLEHSGMPEKAGVDTSLIINAAAIVLLVRASWRESNKSKASDVKKISAEPGIQHCKATHSTCSPDTRQQPGFLAELRRRCREDPDFRDAYRNKVDAEVKRIESKERGNKKSLQAAAFRSLAHSLE